MRELEVGIKKVCFQFTLTLSLVSVVLCMSVHSASALACTPISPQPLSWWPGDGHAADISGGHHGSLTGTATFGSGKIGQGFDFDGSGWLGVPDNPDWTLGTHDFTIELWTKFNSLTGLDPFIAHTNGAGPQDKWIFWYNSTGHDRLLGTPALRFMMENMSGAGTPHDIVVAPWNPTAGQWYHLAVTKSGDTYKLYINGNLVATDSSSAELPNPNAPLTIGRAEAFTLNGEIDEPTVYNRALASQEISQIFDSGSEGKCKPTIPIPEYSQTGSILALAAGAGLIAFVRKRGLQ